MTGFSRIRLGNAGRTWLLLAAGLSLVAGFGAGVLSGSDQRVVVEFLIVVGLVVSLQTFVGNSGVLSFGHVAFIGTGAYAAALVTIPVAQKERLLPDLPSWIAGIEWGLPGAVAASVLAVFVLAVFTGGAISRMEETGMAMATLALLVMMHTVFANWEAATRGTIGILGIPDLIGIATALGTSLLILAIAVGFTATPAGLRLMAAREDPVAAAALGISVPRARFIGWMVSAVSIGIGGAVWSLNSVAFGPGQFYFAQTFALLAMLVIGGMGSVTGAVLGAAVVTLLSELLRGLEGGIQIGAVTIAELPGLVQMATAVLIMAVLILRPRGLSGGRELGSR